MGQKKKKKEAMDEIIINNSDENQLDADSASQLFDNLFSDENMSEDKNEKTEVVDIKNVSNKNDEIDFSNSEIEIEDLDILESESSENSLSLSVEKTEIGEIDLSFDETDVGEIELSSEDETDIGGIDFSIESTEVENVKKDQNSEKTLSTEFTLETKISKGLENEIEFGSHTEVSDFPIEDANEVESNGNIQLEGIDKLETDNEITSSYKNQGNESSDIGEVTELLPSVSEFTEDNSGLTKVTECLSNDIDSDDPLETISSVKFDSKSELNEVPTQTDFAVSSSNETKVDLSEININVPAVEDLSKVSNQSDSSITKKIVRNQGEVANVNSDHLHEYIKENKDLLHFNEEEQIKMKSNLKLLREEREKLSNSINDLEIENEKLRADQARKIGQLDELKIENKILRSRYQKELENLSLSIKLSEDKRRMQIEKNQKYEKEIDDLTIKVRQDVSHVRNKERELENQLELLKSDTKVQIENRDSVIVELKRKVEALEFNIENISMAEVRSKQEVEKMSDKLSKVINTLRASIEMLEGETDSFSSREFLSKIKL